MMIAMMHDGRSVRLLCAMIQGKIGDRKGVQYMQPGLRGRMRDEKDQENCTTHRCRNSIDDRCSNFEPFSLGSEVDPGTLHTHNEADSYLKMMM